MKGMRIKRRAISRKAKGRKRTAALPMKWKAFFSSRAPRAPAMETAQPRVRPAMMTIIMCMTWLPMETPVTGAAPLYWPVMKRSAMP